MLGEMQAPEHPEPNRDRFRLPVHRQIAVGILLGLVLAGGITVICSEGNTPDASELSTSVGAAYSEALAKAQRPPAGESQPPLLGAPQAKVTETRCTEPKGGDSDCTVSLEITPLNPTARPFPQEQPMPVSVGSNGCWKAKQAVDVPGPYGGSETLSGCVPG